VETALEEEKVSEPSLIVVTQPGVGEKKKKKENRIHILLNKREEKRKKEEGWARMGSVFLSRDRKGGEKITDGVTPIPTFSSQFASRRGGKRFNDGQPFNFLSLPTTTIFAFPVLGGGKEGGRRMGEGIKMRQFPFISFGIYAGRKGGEEREKEGWEVQYFFLYQRRGEKGGRRYW